ncbi:hypothetical protein V1506DRAFT_345739 [Lipomyces tetrasporus]
MIKMSSLQCIVLPASSPDRSEAHKSISTISQVLPHRICGYSNTPSLWYPQYKLVMPFNSHAWLERHENDSGSPVLIEGTPRTQDRFSAVFYSDDMLSPTNCSARGVMDPRLNTGIYLTDGCYLVDRAAELAHTAQYTHNGERRDNSVFDGCQLKVSSSCRDSTSMKYIAESNASNAGISITAEYTLPISQDTESNSGFSVIENSNTHHSDLFDKENLFTLAAETLSQFNARESKHIVNSRTSKGSAFLKKCESYADLPHRRTCSRRQNGNSETFTVHIDSATENLADVDIPVTWLDCPHSSTLKTINGDEGCMVYASPQTRIAKREFDKSSPIVLVRGNTGDSEIEQIFPPISIIPKVILTLPEGDSER